MKLLVRTLLSILAVAIVQGTAENNFTWEYIFEYNLDKNITMLLDKYFPAMHKPFLYDNTVYAYAELFSILDVNEVEETITLKLWLYVSYLIANIEESTWIEALGDLAYITPPANKVWKPDIVILNSIETIESSWEDPVIMRLCCYRVGERCVVFCPFLSFPYALTAKTHCLFDVTDFPFDYQYCHLDIGPWYTSLTKYPRSDNEFTGTYKIQHPEHLSQMKLKAFIPNSQWEVIRVRIENTTRSAFVEMTETFDMMRYTIEMKRKPGFYFNTLVLPCVLLTILDVFSVFLPVESGEKVGLAITIMLAQVVNLLILSSILPSSSSYFPSLGRYFLLSIGVIGLTVVYNCCVTCYFYNDYSFVTRNGRKVVKRMRRQKSPSPDDSEQMTDISDPNNVNNRHGQPSLQGSSGVETSSGKEGDFDSDDQVRHRKQICVTSDFFFGLFILGVLVLINAFQFAKFF